MIQFHTFTTLLSKIHQQLPPTRVLIGVAVAFVSYCVTNIWKADIDDAIKKYSGLIERSATIESNLRTLAMFQALESSLSELAIEVRNTKAMGGTQAATASAPPANRILHANRDERVAAAWAMFFIVEFFGALPKELLSLPYREEFEGLKEAKDYINVHLLYDQYVIRDCLERVGSKDGVETTPYGEKLAQNYVKAMQKRIAQWDRTRTIGTIVENVLGLLNLRKEISESDVGPNIEIPKDQSRVADCLYEGDKMTYGLLIQLSQVFRRTITEEIIRPKTATKRWIERVEIALYGISGLIALFGTKSPPERPRESPIRRSNSEIELLRRLKSRRSRV